MSKKLLMINNYNNNNETWDYEWYATEGVLPVYTASDIGGVAYGFKNDYLNIAINDSSSYIKFTTNKTTSNNAIIETMVCANQLFATDNGIRVQLSNGTFGCQIRISSYNDYALRLDKLYGKSSSNRKLIRYLETTTYYKVKLELNGNATKIYLNDELLDTSNVSNLGTENDVSYAEGCYTSSHGVIFQNKPTSGRIKYIKFKEF